jgi:HD superfamily phosphohydrolase/NAD-dependent SIR2 family protein deacetylase
MPARVRQATESSIKGASANQESELDRARDLLLCTWRQGRRVLVVLGAGASVKAGVPRMKDVFSKLRDRLQTALTEKNNACSSGTLSRLQELHGWFDSLAREGAPRSIAAMALGIMQRAHETAPQGELSKLLHKEWLGFSSDFIAEVASKRNPTAVHKKVAEWAISGGADLISVNFDGLTRCALEEVLGNRNDKARAVILSQPAEISRYFLGGNLTNEDAHTLFPVIKIWGDVFHAVCITSQCPQSGIRAPVFSLRPEGNKVEALCPDCHTPRQLQIFFAGYEEKERSTADSISQLLKFVAPRVGCIMTVGFSGLWDQSLVRFLGTVCSDLNSESTWRRRLANSDDGNPGQFDRAASFWINVDRESRPPLLQELVSFGVSPIHLSIDAEDFAAIAPKFQTGECPLVERYAGEEALSEDQWESLVKEQKPCPKGYKILFDESQEAPGYLSDFAMLRQLGIKTRIALAATDPQRVATFEPEHNRRKHSFGTAHLALLWFRKLASQSNVSPREEERLASIVMFAGVHHDIGHLPFTHLAEEIFSEVHWTIEDWVDEFHHDEAALANCFGQISNQMLNVSEKIAVTLGASKEEFLAWVESAIQARSGFHWIDAILNSPLDADKLDYVLRDCRFLNQGIHIPLGIESGRWMESFFSNTRVLPAGLVALEGIAGEHARDFLEERRWLYKHQYHQPGYRALEKLASSVILHWLLHRVPQEIVKRNQYTRMTTNFVECVRDTSSLKGRVARDLLWSELKQYKGEPALLMHICEDLANTAASDTRAGAITGLPLHSSLQAWATKCLRVFKSAFEDWHPKKDGEFSLAQHLIKKAGVTCSETIYVPVTRLKEIRETIRRIETLHPFRALFDVAVVPRMLSYPPRRRLDFGSDAIYGECFAVSHFDPDRWASFTGKWMPLSESAFADRDRNRWAKVIVVSPEPNDPSVIQSLDRFRNLCREQNISCMEVDPDADG